MGGGGVVGGFMGWVIGGFMGWVVVGWVVGGFMGWVGVWWYGWWWGAWWGGWLESSWVDEYLHPPHPGVLGMMGGWAWA